MHIDILSKDSDIANRKQETGDFIDIAQGHNIQKLNIDDRLTNLVKIEQQTYYLTVSIKTTIKKRCNSTSQLEQSKFIV